MRRSSYFSFILIFVISFSSAISDYRWYMCNNASTYTDGSTYSSNLNQVMSDLQRSTPQSLGFNTTSLGQTPNKIYGLLQCIGDISAEKCSDCAQQANNSVHEVCNNSIGALIWMDDCFLRYDNSNFISTLDSNAFYYLFNANNISDNMDDFKATTSSLLYNLSNLAYNPSNKRFALGSANYSPSLKVYGLVQCWRDLSASDCRACLFAATNNLDNCCSVKEGAQAISPSCTVRFEIYQFFDSIQSSPAPSSEGSSVKTQSEKKSLKTLHIILGLVGGVFLALVIRLIVMRKRVRSALFGNPVTIVSHNEERPEYSPESGFLIHDQQHFIMSLDALAGATQNFNENNKLGEGGFGSVYRGTTAEGNNIAVKKLSARSTQGKKEFMNEVKLMSNVRHRNLVKLLGCCAEGNERLLVYEYFPNKSLDNFLFDPEKRRQLDWPKCYNIIVGIARGLLYLHEDSQLRIIHRDIKVNNILLDDKLNPKIADFGLARLFPENVTQIETRVAGTYGYMAPEYAMLGQLSVKTDVYSFGVLVLEVVSGRRNMDPNLPYETQNILQWTWRLYRRGQLLTIVGSTIRESCTQDHVLRCIHIALLCVQADPAVRPAMSNIVMMLSSNAMTLPNPTRPAFLWASEPNAGEAVENNENNENYKNRAHPISESQTSETTASSEVGVPSINKTTVTDLAPR